MSMFPQLMASSVSYSVVMVKNKTCIHNDDDDENDVLDIIISFFARITCPAMMEGIPVIITNLQSQ